MIYYLISAAWIVTTVISWIYENRKVPMITGVLGLITQVAIWSYGLGFIGIAILGVLAIIAMFSVPEVFFGGGI
jgi:hypothetical protein